VVLSVSLLLRQQLNVDPDLPRGEAGEKSVGSGRDAFEDGVVGEGGEDDVGGLADLTRRFAPEQPSCTRSCACSRVSSSR
jgi:hypothetical protein